MTFVVDRGAVADRIRGFLRDGIVVDPAAPLDDDTPLLRGRVDSVGLMELVTFVEAEFGVELELEDIDEEHFGTIGRLAELVETRRTSVRSRP
jgi:acyl carrier protein